MLTIIKIIIVVILVLSIYLFITRNYVNPYKLIFLFGKKGSGKSTLLTKLGFKYLRKGWTVYSTEVPQNRNSVLYNPSSLVERTTTEVSEELQALIRRSTCPVDAETPSKNRSFGRSKRLDFDQIRPIQPTEIFSYQFPPKSCILIDEVSLIWDNRDFKRMDKRVVEWFRYQRHHKCRVYFFSQTFDIDKKLRDLADEMYLVNKYLRVFVVASHIVRKPVVVHPGPESPARIDDDMVVDGPLLAFFGGKLFAFIPYWARRFNSFKLDRKEDTAEKDTIEQNKNSAVTPDPEPLK